jgi:hypothetical protein
MAMLDVYLTVDAECSMGGAWDDAASTPVGPELAILGRSGSKSYGLPLIMDILEAHRLRATFFVEVLAGAVVGDETLGEAYAPITKRGHDAQLHLHPVFHYYDQVRRGRLSRDLLPTRMDLIGALPLETQHELLEKGITVYRRLLGRSPIAFRAGNYGASRETLGILEKIGFLYDSSFNAAYTDSSCLIQEAATNRPWRTGDLCEVPLTVFETGRGRFASLKPLDVGAVSFLEFRSVLRQAEVEGLSCVNISFHSFSLFKKSDRVFSRIRPDRLVIRRLRRLCRFLASHPERFRVRTFSEAVVRPGTGPAALPSMGTVLPTLRRCLQGANRPYWI